MKLFTAIPSVKCFYTCLFLSAVLLTSSSYADWRNDADARIESIRKRNAQITVIDHNGDPVPNITVQIEQIKHRFAFGTSIRYWPLLNYSGYRDFILNHFEWAVCDDDTKWGVNEPTRDNENYNNADYIYNWCAANGIKMRGHCLFWEQVNGQFPTWVTSLPYAPYPAASELLGEVDERINSAVHRFKDKFYNWDVDNEMLSDDFFTSRLGVDGIVHMHNAAKAIDPNCGMFTNEYSGNSWGQYAYNSGPYVTVLNNLLSRGATIDGIGIQSHLGTDPIFDPNRYYTDTLQPLAVFNLPIWATEFDANEANDVLRADIMENFYRICFSHPSVEGIMMWGFMQGQTWQSDWWMLNSNWTLNLTGQRYEALMDEWTTSDTNNTDPNGKAGFRGFHGTYQITLSAPGKNEEVYLIELEPADTTAQFIFETYISPEPDPYPPTPSPMTWAVPPAATGPSSITMTATTAADDSLPVQYYFECTNDGNASSDWQTETTYVARNLYPNTQYSFRVKARDNDVNHNETDWSSTLSATTLPPSTQVQIVGSWASGLSHTKEAGYNRALLFIAHVEDGGAINLSAVTYGGQPMTKVIDQIVGTTYRSYIAAYILDEAGVAAATSGTFAPTWSTNPDNVAYSSVFLQNVDQTAPVGMTDSNSMSIVPPAGSTITTEPLGTIDGDMVIAAAACGYQSTYTSLNNGFTKALDHLMDSSAGIVGYKSASGTAETPSATHPYVNREVIIGLVIKAGVPSTCEEIQSGGFAFAADLNGDCYVDYQDLDIVSDYWLNTDCGGLNNCGGADFEPADGDVDFADFSTFADQWMWCNNPQDMNCAIY